MTLRAVTNAVLILACLAVVACDSMPVVGRRQSSTVRLPAEAVQAELMAYTDSYTGIMSETTDRVARENPKHRRALHDVKLRTVQNAVIIAAGQNPYGGLLDMTVMVTLQRQVAEEYWIPEKFGPPGQPLIDALQLLEREIWLVAERSLDEYEVEALRLLIPELRERFRGQQLVSSIRASDFAADRTTTVANLEGGGSLLSLFQLDPLAGLSPAAQELAQSRLLAERAFFWAKRLPTLFNWQQQDVIMDALNDPETQRIVDSVVGVSESSQRLSVTAEGLMQQVTEERTAALQSMSELVAAEREAALQSMSELVAAEREAALNQAFEGITNEREAILRTFEKEDVRVRGLLEELRATVESSTALSQALTTTIESTERLRTSFSPSQPDPAAGDGPERRPFDITDYKATAEATTATVEQLNGLIASLSDLVDSPAWDQRNEQLAAATNRAQMTMEELIDRSYRRGLVLIGVLVVCSLVGGLAYRFLAVRFIAPRST